MLNESRTCSPNTQSDEYRGKRQTLTDLNSDIEADDIGDQTFLSQGKLLQLRCEAKTVKQSKNQNGKFGVGLKSEQPPESVHIVEGLVDDRKSDDRIHDVGIGMNVPEHAGQQRQAMAGRKKTDVGHNISQAIEKENDTHEKQKVVVARYHVLGAEVHERRNSRPFICFDKRGIAFRHIVSVCCCRHRQRENDQNQKTNYPSMRIRHRQSQFKT